MSVKKEQIEQLTAFAYILKDNGFTVLVDRNHPFHWLYFVKDMRFGNVQPDYFGQFNFGTAHKPGRQHGTGFSTSRETGLTLENANNALIRPGWASNSHVEHYKSVEEFITQNKGGTFADYYIL